MTDRELMAEAAILYYEKKMTQQEIANILYLSRQTVSKLLTEALENGIVEITVHHPKKNCERLEHEIEEAFGIEKSVVAGAGSSGDSMRMMMTVKAAIAYLTPTLEAGGLNLAVCWGRTMQALIAEMPTLQTDGNTVFPLFGATDHENSYFASNEMARCMADKLGAAIKYAWFPYLPDSAKDRELFMKTSYYGRIARLWESIDLAVIGIGNREIPELFRRTFGYCEQNEEAVGDIATHFFTERGKFLNPYQNTLCASVGNLKKAKKVVAVACGGNKTEAIASALRTGIIDVLVTDEYTAGELLENSRF